MRISDWSSDVCSSDLLADGGSGGQDRQLDRGALELSRREGDLGDVSMSDLGFTHIALVVQDIERSIAFYADYAGMQVVHRRNGSGRGDVVAWISDQTRPFVIVLIQQPGLKDREVGRESCREKVWQYG